MQDELKPLKMSYKIVKTFVCFSSSGEAHHLSFACFVITAFFMTCGGVSWCSSFACKMSSITMSDS